VATPWLAIAFVIMPNGEDAIANVAPTTQYSH
jgi:hypothetical protein